MKWEEVRALYPDKFIKLEIIESHIVDQKEYVDEVAVIKAISDSKEAMKLLSNLKLGVEMGYINNMTTKEIDKLMVDVQPGHQSKIYKSNDYSNRDINRAIYLRKSLEI